MKERIFSDAASLYAAAADYILESARVAIAARGVYRLVLAGGETPRSVYVRLATARADWDRWLCYFGDERCLPLGDVERNDYMARTVWLDRVPIPPANVFSIPAELGADSAAVRYADELAAIGDFDLVLLGLGEDGHTASLFPGQPIDGADVLAVHAAPKPPPERVTLSAVRLSRTRQALFMVTGDNKRAALTAWRQGRDIPARHIAPPGGVDLWVDASAQPKPE
jgi:6-phosphogluconolactonase